MFVFFSKIGLSIVDTPGLLLLGAEQNKYERLLRKQVDLVQVPTTDEEGGSSRHPEMGILCEALAPVRPAPAPGGELRL